MSVYWDVDSPRPDLAPLRNDATADVCVVGLGGSGLTAIREAQARGMSVIGVDAGRIAAGAAGRNGGFMLAGIAKFYHHTVDQLGSAVAKRLYQHTLDEMARIEASLPGVFRRCGVVRAAADDVEYEDCLAHRDALIADGFTADLYEGDQGRGILIPSDGVFHPVRRAAMLSRDALNEGATLHGDSSVTGVAPGTVTTAHGTVTAEHILVAVDGGLGRILPELTGQVRDVRLQMVATGPSAARLEFPVYARDGYDYWQQLPDGSVAIGGGRDVAGDTEWTTSTEPTLTVREYLRSVLDGLGVREPIEHHWAATVGYTSNALPLVTEAQPGVWAIGGYCGTGNVVGALLGRAVVEQWDTGSSVVVADFTTALALAD